MSDEVVQLADRRERETVAICRACGGQWFEIHRPAGQVGAITMAADGRVTGYAGLPTCQCCGEPWTGNGPALSGSGRDQILALLRQAGWEKYSEIPGRYSTWRAPGAETGILVPLNPEREDYRALCEQAMRDLRRALADQQP